MHALYIIYSRISIFILFLTLTPIRNPLNAAPWLSITHVKNTTEKNLCNCGGIYCLFKFT